MSLMKKYRISEEQLFSRTPTPPTTPSLRSLPASRQTPRKLIKLNLQSTSSELLIQPGSIDIFSCNVIPSISRYEVPRECEDGIKIAVKLPETLKKQSNRICRRFRQNTKIGSIKCWIDSEISPDIMPNTSHGTELEPHDNTREESRDTKLGICPGNYLLKHSAPPCEVVGDDALTLADCGIVSNTLLVMEQLDND